MRVDHEIWEQGSRVTGRSTAFHDMDTRRQKILSLLRQGTADKMVRFRADKALQSLRVANQMAEEHARVLEPWVQLTSYRLGHLLMRTARAKDDLQEAEQCFHRATQGQSCVLGPLPFILRLPVLQRLRALEDDPTEVRRLDERLYKAFDRARDAVRWSAKSWSWADRRDDLAEREPAVLQGEFVNLLELCAYFIGADYRSLEGLRDPFEDLRLPNAWCLVSSAGSSPDVRCPHDFIAAEMEVRKGELRPHLHFVLAAYGQSACYFNESTVIGRRPTQRSGTNRELRLITQLCIHGDLPRDKCRIAAVGEDGTSNLFRQVLSRARTMLASAANCPADKTIIEDETKGALRLDPDIRVLGMVEVDVLNAPAPNP